MKAAVLKHVNCYPFYCYFSSAVTLLPFFVIPCGRFVVQSDRAPTLGKVVDGFSLLPALREDFRQKLAEGGYDLESPPGEEFWAIDSQLMVDVLKLKPVQLGALLAKKAQLTGEPIIPFLQNRRQQNTSLRSLGKGAPANSKCHL